MDKYKSDLVVFIGRFQPFHNAHLDIVKKALERADNVLILVGSAHRAPDIKNPFSYDERAEMIKESVLLNGLNNVSVEPLMDYLTDAQWLEAIGETVQTELTFLGIKNPTVGVIGHVKDMSSSYLNYFQQWQRITVPQYPKHGETIDATKIRRLFFENEQAFIEGVVPPPVYEKLTFIKRNGLKQELMDDWEAWKIDKRIWSGTPYPVSFATADAVVVQSGHVLMIRRGDSPGKGQLALPGGHLEVARQETIKQCAFRELKEETSIHVQEKILHRAFVDEDYFDDPARSTFGRRITHAFLYKLDDTQKLPRVKAADDAKEALWVPLTDFPELRNQFFEDHYFIIERMMTKLK